MNRQKRTEHLEAPSWRPACRDPLISSAVRPGRVKSGPRFVSARCGASSAPPRAPNRLAVVAGLLEIASPSVSSHAAQVRAASTSTGRGRRRRRTTAAATRAGPRRSWSCSRWARRTLRRPRVVDRTIGGDRDLHEVVGMLAPDAREERGVLAGAELPFLAHRAREVGGQSQLSTSAWSCSTMVGFAGSAHYGSQWRSPGIPAHDLTLKDPREGWRRELEVF
jgi:hypothetical protein